MDIDWTAADRCFSEWYDTQGLENLGHEDFIEFYRGGRYFAADHTIFNVPFVAGVSQISLDTILKLLAMGGGFDPWSSGIIGSDLIFVFTNKSNAAMFKMTWSGVSEALSKKGT